MSNPQHSSTLERSRSDGQLDEYQNEADHDSAAGMNNDADHNPPGPQLNQGQSRSFRSECFARQCLIVFWCILQVNATLRIRPQRSGVASQHQTLANGESSKIARLNTDFGMCCFFIWLTVLCAQSIFSLREQQAELELQSKAARFD